MLSKLDPLWQNYLDPGMKAVALLLMIHCLLLLPLFVVVFVFGPCFVELLVSFLVLQSLYWGIESWFIYFNCLLSVIHSR